MSPEESWPDDDRTAIPPFLFDPIGVVRRRYPWMLLLAVVGIAATTALVWRWSPRYRAEATVLITSQQLPSDFVRSTVAEDSIANLNAMLGQVLSREKLGRILESVGLYRAEWNRVARGDLVQRMRGQIDVAPEPGSYGRSQQSLVYRIAFEHDDPEQSAAVANGVAALFVEQSMARRTQLAQRATDFLRQELARDERELRDQSRLVAEFRGQHRGELPSEFETNLRKLEMLSERRSSLATQISEKENLILQLEQRPVSDEARTPNERLLEELRRALTQELAIHTEDHPNVAGLRRRIEGLEQIVAEERGGSGVSGTARQIAATRAEIALLRRQLAETEAAIAQRDERIDRTHKVGDELDALLQKEKILLEDYLETLRKVEQAELAENLESAQQGAQVSVLDSARPPNGPLRPRWHLAGAGLIGTLALSIGLALLLELLDPVVLSAAQVEGIAGRPVLGSLPRMT